METGTTRTFDESYQLLVGYKEKLQGSFKGIRQEDPKLCKWIDQQKQYHKQGQLKPDQKEKLEKIGIDLERTTLSWDESYQLLVAFKAGNKGSFKGLRQEDPKLYKWIDHQKEYHKQGKLNEDQIIKLRDIGIPLPILLDNPASHAGIEEWHMEPYDHVGYWENYLRNQNQASKDMHAAAPATTTIGDKKRQEKRQSGNTGTPRTSRQPAQQKRQHPNTITEGTKKKPRLKKPTTKQDRIQVRAPNHPQQNVCAFGDACFFKTNPPPNGTLIDMYNCKAPECNQQVHHLCSRSNKCGEDMNDCCCSQECYKYLVQQLRYANAQETCTNLEESLRVCEQEKDNVRQ